MAARNPFPGATKPTTASRTATKAVRRLASAAKLVQQSRRVSPAEKAAYHAVVGAGRSRVIRDFFALNTQDETDITAVIDKALDTAIGGTA